MRSVLAAGLSVLGGLQAGCSPDVESKPEASKPEPKEHLVQIARVTTDTLAMTSVHTGSLRNRRTVRIFNQEEGRVTALPFYEGDRVDEGDVLLRLDDALLQAELAKASATRGQAEVDLRRLKRLQRSKVVAEEEVTRAATAVEVAKSEERILTTRLGYTTVRAPFAGLVSARLAEPGDILPRHTHVLTVSDPTSLITELTVSELLLPHLNRGDPATVRIDALGDHGFEGAVLRMHPDLDPRTRKGRVEVVLTPVPDGARAGQFARVTFTTQALGRKVIPFSALRRDRDSEFVFRVDDDGHARRAPVHSGQRLADRVEILEGLENGEPIVVKGFLGLKDGAAVTPVNDPSPSDDAG